MYIMTANLVINIIKQITNYNSTGNDFNNTNVISYDHNFIQSIYIKMVYQIAKNN